MTPRGESRRLVPSGPSAACELSDSIDRKNVRVLTMAEEADMEGCSRF
jgi:hypothetical protein